MTTATHCPDCGGLLVRRDGSKLDWKHCNRCGWDEEQELREKIRQELANEPSCYD